MKALLLIIFITVPAFAQKGGKVGSGGGDAYVLDVIRIAGQEVYPWLVGNGKTLKPPVDATQFLIAIDPKSMSSQEKVYESCNGSNTGREVEICYNENLDQFFISRSLYPLNGKTCSKTSLVAHELFRKMGLEGDDYEVSKQMPQIKSCEETPTVVYKIEHIEIDRNGFEKCSLGDQGEICRIGENKYRFANWLFSGFNQTKTPGRYSHPWLYPAIQSHPGGVTFSSWLGEAKEPLWILINISDELQLPYVVERYPEISNKSAVGFCRAMGNRGFVSAEFSDWSLGDRGGKAIEFDQSGNFSFIGVFKNREKIEGTGARYYHSITCTGKPL